MQSIAELSASLGIQTGPELLQALQERQRKPLLATHVPELDRLHDGGLRRGTFVDIHGPASSGRFALALAALAAATQAGESAALVDCEDHLDPQGAQASGIDLRRLLWIRPPTLPAALLSAETAITAGFSMVVLNLGFAAPSVKECPPVVWLRLSRTTEEHKAIFIVVGEKPAAGVAADVLVSTHGQAARWEGLLLTGLHSRIVVRTRKGRWGERAGSMVFHTPQSMGQ